MPSLLAESTCPAAVPGLPPQRSQLTPPERARRGTCRSVPCPPD